MVTPALGVAVGEAAGVAASVAWANTGEGKAKKRIKGKEINSLCFMVLFYGGVVSLSTTN